MKALIHRVLAREAARGSLHLLAELGVNPFKTYQTLRGVPAFVTRHLEFRRQARRYAHECGPLSMRPHFGDRFDASGSASGHYFHQDLLVAQRVFENQPRRHVDIGSRIDGFVAHVASFREVEVFDIRPLHSSVRNIVFRRADLSEPHWPFIDYCDSISSLHAIEHIGLGRYGDPVCYRGHINALENIWRALHAGGKFYFSVPMGRQRVEYDGQRVFHLKYLLTLLDRYVVDSFSYVADDGSLHENVQLGLTNIESNFGCEYGCAIFELTKTT
jgi:hypothetical protein